jgi:hypothetical protein
MNNEVERSTFLFRRLISAMVVFGATYQTVRAFRSIIGASVEFNRKIETARLGIAALITSSGLLVDNYNKIVPTAEKFAYAQTEARRQTALLRRDALATEATFQELVDTFQIAVAPGITGGLNLDEIRKFTIRISQAATALQMPQRQLAEEIRSILQGTIRPQNTRIATAMQIRSEDIKKWRQAGTLARELFTQFEGFGLAGEQLKDTFTGLTGRVKDAFQQLAGEAGRGLFSDLKDIMKEALDIMVTFTDKGVVFKPEALALMKTFFDSLRQGLQDAKNFATGLSLADLQSAMTSIAEAMRLISSLLVGIARGVKDTLTNLSAMKDAVMAMLEGMGVLKDTQVSLADMTAKSTEIFLTWLAITTAAKVMLTTVKLVDTAMGVIKRSAIAFSAAMNASTAVWGVIIAGALYLAKVLNEGISKELGISDDFVTQLIVGFKILANFTKLIAGTMSSGFKIASELLTQALDNALVTYLELYRAYLVVKRELVKTVGTDEAFLGTLKAIDKVDDKLYDARKKREVQNQQSANRLEEQYSRVVDLWKNFDWAAGVDQIRESAQKSGGGLEYLRKSAKDFFSTSLSDFFSGKDVNKAIKEATEAEGARAEEAAKKSKTALENEKQLYKLKQLNKSLDGSQLTKLREAVSTYETQKRQTAELIQLRRDNNLYGSEEDERADVAAMNVLLFDQAEKVKKLAQSFDLLALQAEGGAFNAMEHGLLKFAYNTKTVFEGISDTISSILDKLASTISQTIVDAFDPNKEVDLRERFGRFLQDISQMMIQTFLKIAMAKAVMGLVGGGVGGNIAAGAGIGFARGGRIGGRRGAASLAHYLHPQGLAAGGRPKGLHPSDTVPIWAAPGEFMMKVAAVRKYGADVMQSINQGLIDPGTLKGLAGAHQAIKRPRSSGPGYAEGGEITKRDSVPVGAPSAGPAQAFIVANDEAAEKLFHGGSGAIIRWMRKNQNKWVK